jgi:hypothetical protein
MSAVSSTVHGFSGFGTRVGTMPLVWLMAECISESVPAPPDLFTGLNRHRDEDRLVAFAPGLPYKRSPQREHKGGVDDGRVERAYRTDDVISSTADRFNAAMSGSTQAALASTDIKRALE